MYHIKRYTLIFMLFLAGIAFVSCNTEETSTEMTTETMETIEDLVVHQKADVHRENTIYVEDGVVFTKGENGNGQLGVGDFDEHDGFQDITANFTLEEGDEIIALGLGEYHALALSQEGQVFAWGHNAYGKLTLESGPNQYHPINITDEFALDEGEIIINIVVGRDHNGVLTSEGRVFTWGVNAYGQLGIGEKTLPWEGVVAEPQDITDRFNLADDDFIIKLDFGNNHSGALTYQGHVFLWGDNELGQLGIDEEEKLEPYDVTTMFGLADDQIVDLSLGYSHTGVLTEGDRVFVFGDNSLGQLGVGDDVDNTSDPMEITESLSQAGDILHLRFDHDSSAIIGEDEVYVFGYNFNYQLGLDTNATVYEPTLLTNDLLEPEAIVDVVIAKLVYLIIYEDGNIMSYGPFEQE